MTGRAPGCGSSDHVLLNHRNFFRGHFDAEIAASDHHAVGDFENFFQVIDGLRLFQLGDDRNVAAVIRNNLFHCLHVGGGADERKRDRIDALLEAEFEILTVFVRQSLNGERDSGQVDAFVLPEHSAIQDLADYVFAFDRIDAEFD